VAHGLPMAATAGGDHRRSLPRARGALAAEVAFDDFAGGTTDSARNREILGL
jgi:hypothetical protein